MKESVAQSIAAPALSLTTLFALLEDFHGLVASGLVDPKDFQDVLGTPLNCTCWSVAWILEVFCTVVGIPARSLALFPAPLIDSKLPSASDTRINVRPYVPYGLGEGGAAVWEVADSHALVPPADAVIHFDNHVVCVVGSPMLSQEAELDPSTRIFDLTMWANRLASKKRTGAPVARTDAWQAGDTYGLPFSEPSVFNYSARRLVDTSQSLYCYLLPTPTIE